MSPLPIVTEIPRFCPIGTRVLDIGVGTGRNTRFLAQHGFQVDAIDRSAQKIVEINQYAAAHALPVRAMVHDIRGVDPEFRGYDLILCTLTLHYLTHERANSFLANARMRATPGTLHVLGAITVVGDFSHEYSPGERFYPGSNELHRTYSDEGWVIHRAYEEERIMHQTHPDGSPMLNEVAFLIARKPSPFPGRKGALSRMARG
jgi:tellurite methyltransferase